MTVRKSAHTSSDKSVGHRPNNEGRVCDAVLRMLEQRAGILRADVRLPEKNGIGPAVELRVKVGTQEYAIEHTEIEAFEKQIKTGVVFQEVSQFVERELSGTLPGPASYRLVFPIDISLPGKRNERARALSGLCQSIRMTAQRLHERNQGNLDHWSSPYRSEDGIQWTPTGFTHSIRLDRWPNASRIGQHPGSLRTLRAVGDDLEDLRTTRLLRALRTKCPKLHSCRAEGARTILVVESDDVALTNCNLVAAALVDLSKRLTGELQFPDEIFYVETYTDRWVVWPIKYDAEYQRFEDRPGWEWIDFHVDDLIDLTE